MHDAPQDEPYHVFPHLAIEEAPDPPVPEEANLGKLHWMQFDVDRYQGSIFAMTASLAGQGAALNLWLYAWKQPGICLPNDERVLARVCGLNWQGKEWNDVKEEALDKFYVCSNGKLYHPYLSELGRDSWAHYQKKVEGGKKGASRRYGEGDPSAQAMHTHSTSIGPPKGDPMVHNTTLQDTIEVPKGTLSGTKPRPREKAPVKEIIEYLNKTAGTNFSPSTKATINMLNARWQESKNIKRYKLVIDYLCSKWLKDDQMAGYLRPATIFQASKFEGYAEDGIRWADKTGYTLEENE